MTLTCVSMKCIGLVCAAVVALAAYRARGPSMIATNDWCVCVVSYGRIRSVAPAARLRLGLPLLHATILLAEVRLLRHGHEQASLHDSWQRQQRGVQLLRLVDDAELRVDDEVAIVGDTRPGLGLCHAKGGLATQRLDLLHNWNVREWQHLHRA